MSEAWKGHIFRRTVPVFVVSPQWTRAERLKLTEERKIDFMARASEALGVPVGAFSNCTFHHVIPLYLGGTSDDANVVLIRKGAHKSAHAHIGAQTKHAVPGQVLSVEIPFPTNAWVWDLSDYFDAQGRCYFSEEKRSQAERYEDSLAALREELSIYSETNRKKAAAAALQL